MGTVMAGIAIGATRTRRVLEPVIFPSGLVCRKEGGVPFLVG